MPLPRNFPTPQHLREAFDAYKDWAKTNPLKVHDFVGKDAKEVHRKKERPLSLSGFNAWCIREGFGLAEHYFTNQDNDYTDYLGICRAIKEEIRADQIDGGMAGIYNPSITQRLNSLNETQTIEHKGNLPEWMKK
jgi:hypothetical protein